jgi:hypothetical protein
MSDKLYLACIIFFTIDLTLVGTTCVCVMMLVRKVMLGKVEIKIAGKTKRLDRDFITTGDIKQEELVDTMIQLSDDRKYVSEP